MQKKILLIDDEKKFVHNLQMSLEMYGFEVLCAYDGKEAIEKFYSMEPDLVIMDLVMPNFDGDKVAMTFKKVQHGKNVPIIVLSALADERRVEQSMRFGVDAYLTKPYDLDELRAKIDELLGAQES